MSQQNYSNHVRFYTVHHFIFYPIISICFGASIWFAVNDPSNKLIWSTLAIVFLFIAWESYMLRQHYALTAQNRTIRLELRLRYFALTQKRFEDIEKQLSLRQLFALRFASDGEFLSLTDRTLNENLTGEDIKKAIVHWKGDYCRV